MACVDISRAVYSALNQVAFGRLKVDELVPFLSDTGCGRSSLVRKVRILSSLRESPAADSELRLTIPKFKPSKPLIATARSELLVACTLLASLLVRSGNRPSIFQN